MGQTLEITMNKAYVRYLQTKNQKKLMIDRLQAYRLVANQRKNI